MLVSLTKTVVQQLETLDRLEAKGNEARNSDNTNLALKELNTEISRFRNLVLILGERLAPAILESALDEGVKLAQRVRFSRQAFLEGQNNQSAELAQIKNSLSRQRQQLINNWQSQVDRQLERYRSRLKLVKFMPEIKAQQGELNNFFNQLERYRETLPQSNLDLQYYDEALEQLSIRLERVEGLSDSIKAFLDKLGENRASIADLDEEVLLWCRDKKRAKFFKITFESSNMG